MRIPCPLSMIVIVWALSGCKEPAPAPATNPRNDSSAPIGSARTAPQVVAPPLDGSCTRDDECVPAPGCCPAPCTSVVINVKELAHARALLDACPHEECPSAGSCVTHAYLCVNGRCALVFEGDKAYHPR